VYYTKGLKRIGSTRLRATPTPSPDVRFSHPGFRSLGPGCAPVPPPLPASCRLPATPALGVGVARSLPLAKTQAIVDWARLGVACAKEPALAASEGMDANPVRHGTFHEVGRASACHALTHPTRPSGCPVSPRRTFVTAGHRSAKGGLVVLKRTSGDGVRAARSRLGALRPRQAKACPTARYAAGHRACRGFSSPGCGGSDRRCIASRSGWR
jgi:hypothetical protein